MVFSSRQLTFVSSRSPWQSDTSDLNLENLVKEGTMSQEGYINVASRMGLSGERGTEPRLLLSSSNLFNTNADPTSRSFDLSPALGYPTVIFV